MPPRSIVITHNPVTNWENFHLTLGADREDFRDYADDDRSMGGYWSCAFKMCGRKNVIAELFENGLGRNVESFGRGIQTLYEGLIFEMVYNLPPDQYTISLQNMINKIWSRSDYDADGEMERSTVIENADSQARFGTKVQVISGGQLDSLAVADQAVQAFIDLRAFPKPIINKGRGRGDPYLEIFSKGYIETLNWLTYNQLAAGSQEATLQFVAAVAGAEFVDSVETESNSTLVIKKQDADQRILDIINNLARLGDASNNRWLVYMTKGRILHFAQAAPSVEVV